MPPQIQERIFAPFFTTKEVGKGTGLGLSICSELIKDFGGNITVESTMDVGTTFKIQFPSLERDTRHEPVH
jgi:two-component system NtrC family sensor kinase